MWWVELSCSGLLSIGHSVLETSGKAWLRGGEREREGGREEVKEGIRHKLEKEKRMWQRAWEYMSWT